MGGDSPSFWVLSDIRVFFKEINLDYWDLALQNLINSCQLWIGMKFVPPSCSKMSASDSQYRLQGSRCSM